MASSGSGPRGRGRRRGSRAGARGRGRGRHDVILDEDLASLPAMDLMAHLHNHRTSQYLFVGVSMVFHERERRLAQAQDRAREADGLRAELSASKAAEARLRAEVEELRRKAAEVEEGLRGEIRGRELAAAAADAESTDVARLRAEVEEWWRRAMEAEAVADSLRGEIRDRERSAAAAETAEARLRGEVDQWRRRAVEAVAVVDGFRGVRAEIRTRELSAAAEKDQIRRAAADAEARLRGEVEEWRRRAVEAEARLVQLAKHDMLPAGEELDGGARTEADTGLVRTVASPPAPTLQPDLLLLLGREPGVRSVADHRGEASEVVSDKDEANDTNMLGNSMGDNMSHDEDDNVLVNIPALEVIPPELQVLPETDLPEPTRAKKKKWTIRGDGMFYNMVSEALKEKEKAASEPPNYRCWLYAPRSSR